MEKLGLGLMGGLILPSGPSTRQREAHEAWMKEYEWMMLAGMAAQKTTWTEEGPTVEPVTLERLPP